MCGGGEGGRHTSYITPYGMSGVLELKETERESQIGRSSKATPRRHAWGSEGSGGHVVRSVQ